MPKPSRNKPKPRSLTELARSLDTRKRPPPAPPTPARRSAGRAAAPPAPPPDRKADLVARLAQRPAPAAPPLERGRPAAPASTGREAALASLHRRPSPAPSSARPPQQADARRQYPRADVQARARLSLADDPSRSFEATLPTLNLSVGGMFLESSFFLKPGTRLLVELQLPGKDRVVRVKAEVVRVETTVAGASGFALRFTEYLDGSQVTLATHFLSPVLRQFLLDYAREHRLQASPEYLAHTADVLAAWELKKAELGGDVWGLTAKQPA